MHCRHCEGTAGFAIKQLAGRTREVPDPDCEDARTELEEEAEDVVGEIGVAACDV